jgi:hypothetical protein
VRGFSADDATNLRPPKALREIGVTASFAAVSHPAAWHLAPPMEPLCIAGSLAL